MGTTLKSVCLLEETEFVRKTAKTLVLKIIQATKDGKTADVEEIIDGLEKIKNFCLESTPSGKERRPHLKRLAYTYTVNTWNFDEQCSPVVPSKEEGTALHFVFLKTLEGRRDRWVSSPRTGGGDRWRRDACS